tara:strand:+ start:714 stop:1250 length:537 start_codon:yes stop_codon:yes gene_type:complete
MEKIWINDIHTLYKFWFKIFPNKNMSRNENLNSIARFGFILLFSFLSIKSNNTWFAIPLILITSSILLYKNENEIDNKKCRLPTIDNPHMNSTQYSENIPACDRELNKKKIYKFHNHNLYKNSNDYFDNKNLKLQFYTKPVSERINNTKLLGNLLYKSDGNCKYNNSKCLRYEDERYH